VSQPPSETPPSGSAERGGVPAAQTSPGFAGMLRSGGSPGHDAAAGPGNMRPYFVWDAILGGVMVLLLIVVLVAIGGRQIGFILGQAGYVGLAAAALAISLRTATPNLAVGSIGALAGGLGAVLATQAGWDLPVAMMVAVGIATMVGFVIGIVVAGLSVPAWAATLAAAVMIDMVLIALIGSGGGIPLPGATAFPTALWFVLFAAVSIGGGLLWWLIPDLRGILSRGRRAGEPAAWTGLTAGIGGVIGLTVSSALAGLAGVAMTGHLRFVQPGSAAQVTATALAAALLGGVSVFGRRGGVAGTFCAVLILVTTRTVLAYYDAPFWVTGMVVGVIAVLGLGVSRLLENLSAAPRRTQPAGPAGSTAAGPPPGPTGVPAGQTGTPAPGVPHPAASQLGRPPGAPPPPSVTSPPPTKPPQNPPRPY
jgi:ribose/xylose/arabinose/galactoside ABC-type transport system permease subunit